MDGLRQLDVEPDVIDDLFEDTERRWSLPEAAELPCNTGVALQQAARSRRWPGSSADRSLRLIRGDLSLSTSGRSTKQQIALDVLADPSISIVSLGGNAEPARASWRWRLGSMPCSSGAPTSASWSSARCMPSAARTSLPAETGRDRAPGRAVFDALESIAGPEVVEEVM